MATESKKRLEANQIYTHESALLERLKQVANGDISKEELLSEFISLGDEYQKLLRQTIKITRVGDSTQMKLMRMLELEKEKLRLEEVVKERTQEIEEKNQRLEEQTIQLRQMAESKSRFFANISHEFRTPLTLIMGPLEQILADEPSPQLRNKSNLMLRNSRRLLNLVNQLLELARFDSGSMRLEAARQNIFPFVRNVVMCFESMAQQQDVALIIQGEEYSNASLYFDPEKLERILTNLLSNAFNFTSAGGEIIVSVRPVPDPSVCSPRCVEMSKHGDEPCKFRCIEVSVRDTGTGIPAEQLPHIFDRFYRGKNIHDYKRKGTGIGLALTKELVELHAGKIEVRSSRENDQGRGTEFILRFPNKDPNPDSAELESAGTPGSESGATPGRLSNLSASYAFLAESMDDGEETEKPDPVKEVPVKEKAPTLILVVEDHADVRTYIKTTLEPDFEIAEACDGKEGIERAKELIPDLIISDITMPNIDGYELCRVLKKNSLTCHIPIILLTARVLDKNVLEGLESGADDYISKPFSTGILTCRVKNLIQLRRYLQLKHKNRVSFMPDHVEVSPLDEEFYKQVEEVLEEHLADSDFGVEPFSRHFHMSQATLYRKLLALTGQSPTRLIRSYRLKRAAQMLRDGAGTISEVARSTSFLNRSYFSRCFKDQFLCLPSEFCPGLQAETKQDTQDDVKLEIAGSLTPETGSGKDVILVVEDSEDTRNYIRSSLEPDYHVVEAENGSEGIARAIELIPDLIISDIMMPDTDGYQLCRTLKKDLRTSHTPIILLTAKASEESIIKGLDTGADDYVTKPFNTDILRARIKNLIQLRNHLQMKRIHKMSMMPTEITESDSDQEFMRDLNQVIRKNLSEPEFNVEQLSQKLYMSNATIYRKILALTGEIPSEYLRSCRLKEAAKLLRKKVSVTEAAFQVGFNSRAYFTRCFKEKFHQLPSVYIASQTG